MAKVKTNELTGAALDWAVAQCEQLECEAFNGNVFLAPKHAVRSGNAMRIWRPSANWSHGGPIIEREIGNLWKGNKLNPQEPDVWTAAAYLKATDGTLLYYESGPTPLVAAMRCYVASKLGDEVDVPEVLLGAVERGETPR